MTELADFLEAVNRRQCVPRVGDHPTDKPGEIAKIAASIHRRRPCRRKRERDPAVDEILRAASDVWYGRFLRGGGRSKIRDVFRAMLEAASKRAEIRAATVDGVERRGLVFEDSCRQLGEAANTHYASASRHRSKLREMGVIVPLGDPGKAAAGLSVAWLVLEPAPNCNTPTTTARKPLRGTVVGVLQ